MPTLPSRKSPLQHGISVLERALKNQLGTACSLCIWHSLPWCFADRKHALSPAQGNPRHRQQQADDAPPDQSAAPTTPTTHTGTADSETKP